MLVSHSAHIAVECGKRAVLGKDDGIAARRKLRIVLYVGHHGVSSFPDIVLQLGLS